MWSLLKRALVWLFGKAVDEFRCCDVCNHKLECRATQRCLSDLYDLPSTPVERPKPGAK